MQIKMRMKTEAEEAMITIMRTVLSPELESSGVTSHSLVATHFPDLQQLMLPEQPVPVPSAPQDVVAALQVALGAQTPL